MVEMWDKEFKGLILWPMTSKRIQSEEWNREVNPIFGQNMDENFSKEVEIPFFLKQQKKTK
jgi:hypothetical protein